MPQCGHVVFVNARIFSRSELRGRGSFRPSFVLAACCEPAAKALRVQSDEKTGRMGRTSLGRHRTFQCGIRRFQCRSRSTAGLLRGCMKCHGLLDCEIQRLRIDSYSLNCFFKFSACHDIVLPGPLVANNSDSEIFRQVLFFTFAHIRPAL